MFYSVFLSKILFWRPLQYLHSFSWVVNEIEPSGACSNVFFYGRFIFLFYFNVKTIFSELVDKLSVRYILSENFVGSPGLLGDDPVMFLGLSILVL